MVDLEKFTLFPDQEEYLEIQPTGQDNGGFMSSGLREHHKIEQQMGNCKALTADLYAMNFSIEFFFFY